MKNYLIYLLLAVICAGMFSSCKKRRVARFLDGQFQIERITEGPIVKADILELPELYFDKCKITREDCSGIWYCKTDESSANFSWRLNDNGEMISIFNETNQADAAAADLNRYNGEYTIEEFGEDVLIISSSETNGLPGTLVTIEMREFGNN